MNTGVVNYRVDLRDGGDSVYLPFTDVGASVTYIKNAGGLSVTTSGGTTDSSGTFSTTITVTGGGSKDAATVTFTSGSAVQIVEVIIP